MASSSQTKRTYHVFLSFRGSDVRNNIVSHLHQALKKTGIHTFIDSEDLKKGQRISTAIENAIEDSRFAVIFFSENYASSAWCLDEVVKMMERHETNSLSVLPVFYKVEPREVRNGRNSYKKAFDDHEKKYEKNPEVVAKWKKALLDAGNLSGWEYSVGVIAESTHSLTLCQGTQEDLTVGRGSCHENRGGGGDLVDGCMGKPIVQEGDLVPSRKGKPIQSGSRKFENEAELVKSIEEEISIQLKRDALDVAMHPVGIVSRVDELSSMLNMKSEDEVQDKGLIIGLWAMGGMGKTTLAKALYNSIFRKFQGSAFLESISESSKDPNYMVNLQNKLLSQIFLREETVKSVAAGLSLIKDRLSCKRVLIVLDGVDTLCQIEDLVGYGRWFGDGSRIIVTTRNKVLLKIIEARIYEVTALEDRDAVELLEKSISEDRSKTLEGDQVDNALKCTQRLPHALKVLGSAFRANVNWDDELHAFARSCHSEIKGKLKTSYTELDNTDKEQIFLHIACFFNGWSRNYVEGVLGSCYRDAARMVDDLIQRSLIRDEDGTLQVHVLFELMAKDIVDQDCHENPRTRSRIWRHEDLIDVLSRDKGRDAAVKAIVLALPQPETINIDPNAFANLKMLRFLIMSNVDASFEGPICLPDELRWFEWQDCRASGLEFTSPPKKLAVLSVRKSICKELGKT